MARTLIALALAALVWLSPVSLAQSPPRPAKSKYLVTEGGGFMMKRGEGVMYAMTFSVREKLASPLYATVTFENPENRKSPFVLDLTVEPGQSEILARSPGIKRIKNGKNYKVQVLLYSDESRTERIGKHVQKVSFSLPPGMEAAFGIELL